MQVYCSNTSRLQPSSSLPTIRKLKSFDASLLEMNPDLARERSKASFNVEELTNLLDGGKDKTERRRYLGEHKLKNSRNLDLILLKIRSTISLSKFT